MSPNEQQELDVFLEENLVLVILFPCEGDAADEATIIDYSKTGANKR